MFEGILIAIGILIFIGGVMAVADGAPKGDKKAWMIGATIVWRIIDFRAIIRHLAIITL